MFSNSSAFFYLMRENFVEFDESNKKNLLKDSYDIEFEFSFVNDLARGCSGNLLQVNSSQKFSIKLTGLGALPSLLGSVEYNFVSSSLRLPYFADVTRSVLFDYVFCGNESVVENHSPNRDSINEIGDFDNLFFLPVLRCKVVSQSTKNDKWVLVLEEV